MSRKPFVSHLIVTCTRSRPGSSVSRSLFARTMKRWRPSSGRKKSRVTLADGLGQSSEHPEHRREAAELKPRTKSRDLPASLAGLGAIGGDYSRIFTAGSRSIDRECVRLTFLVELFGESAVTSSIEEVMRTGHVGAEYVEYILRHKRGLAPAPAPLRLGDPVLDAITFREPDLAVYDQLVASRLTLNPGDPAPRDGKPV